MEPEEVYTKLVEKIEGSTGGINDLKVLFATLSTKFDGALDLQTKLYKSVYGNGKPGLLDRTLELENCNSDLQVSFDKFVAEYKQDKKDREDAEKERAKERKQDAKDKKAQWIGLLISIILIIITTFVNLALHHILP